MKSEHRTDEVLWEAFRGRKDRKAIGDLFNRHALPIYNFCLGLSRDAALAEDLTQEVFAKLLSPELKVGEIRQFRSWLYRVAYRQWLLAERSAGRRDARERVKASMMEGAAMTDDPAHQAGEQELARRVQETVADLPEELRVPLTLRYQHDLTYQEISKVLDRPLPTVARHVSEAEGRVREKLTLAGVAVVPAQMGSLMEKVGQAQIPPKVMEGLQGLLRNVAASPRVPVTRIAAPTRSLAPKLVGVGAVILIAGLALWTILRDGEKRAVERTKTEPVPNSSMPTGKTANLTEENAGGVSQRQNPAGGARSHDAREARPKDSSVHFKVLVIDHATRAVLRDKDLGNVWVVGLLDLQAVPGSMVEQDGSVDLVADLTYNHRLDRWEVSLPLKHRVLFNVGAVA